MDAEKKQTARVHEKARTLRTIITVIGFAVGFFCIGLAIYLLIRRNSFQRRAGAGAAVVPPGR